MKTEDVDVLTPFKHKLFYSELPFPHHHWLKDDTITPLARARRYLIEKVDTDWFLFLDDDVEIAPGQVEHLLSFTSDPTIGAVEANSMVPSVDALRRHKTAKVTRGWTGSTLVRTSLVRDWSPPPIRRFEDEHLRQHILKKGRKWVRDLDNVVVHHIENRGYPGPSHLHFWDGHGAWFACTPSVRAKYLLKTPFFARHGRKRFIAHLAFLRGMFSAMTSGARGPR